MVDQHEVRVAIAAFVHERMWWDETLRAIGVGRMEEPGMMGEWSPKDMVAHLSGWQWKTLNSLQATLSGTALPAPPWPAEYNNPDSWDDDGQFEQINQWIHAQAQTQTAEQIMATSREQWLALESLISGLSPQQMADTKLFPRLQGRSMYDVVTSGDFFEHFREHREADIDPWLKKKGRML